MKKKTERAFCFCSNSEADPESLNWTIKDVQKRMIKTESFEGTQLMDSVSSTNFDPKFYDRYWRIENIHLIQNDKVCRQYEDFRKELSGLGRTAESTKDTLLFSVETEKSCKDICQDGYKVGSKKRHVLGHTGSGVHLVQHYDILTRYLTFQQYASPTHVVVFKAFLGKTKPIVPRLHRDDNFVSPNTGFDCHVSARQVDKRMNICEALNCSYVYLYEFDDVASNPVKYPRQILPYAIIQLMKKKIPIMTETPFLAVGASDYASNWEVKGETRRGFRFMFSKSGLKGRHKVFAKDMPSAPIESYLKGQILEMRTKSSKKTSVESPPTLQRIEDEVNAHETICGTKPPSLQKVHTNEPICATHDPSIPITITKPLDPSASNVVNFPYMHVYPQLSQKPLVRLKRLKQSSSKRYKTSLSHGSLVERNSVYEENDKSHTEKDSLDSTNKEPEVLGLSQSENLIVPNYTTKIKSCDGLKAKATCETSAMGSKIHKINEAKRKYGVKSIGTKTKLHKKKHIFKLGGIIRPCTVKKAETVQNKDTTENNSKIKKNPNATKLTKQVSVLEYAVEVNGNTHSDNTCSSIKVKFTRKSSDDVYTPKEMCNNKLNVSTTDSETLVAEKDAKSFQENNCDLSNKCANEHVYQPSLSSYSQHLLNDQSSQICPAQTSQCSINSNQVIIEKSKSPVVANAAPDMLNHTPELASAQTYTANDEAGNRCDSNETAVKSCDKMSFDINESNLTVKPNASVSQSLETKPVQSVLKTLNGTDKDILIAYKHASADRKDSKICRIERNAISSHSHDSKCDKLSGPGEKSTSKRDKRAKTKNVPPSSNNVLCVQKHSNNEIQQPKSDAGNNPVQINKSITAIRPMGSFHSTNMIRDKLVDVHEMKEVIIAKRKEKSPDDKIRLLQAYNECMVSTEPSVPHVSTKPCYSNCLDKSSGKNMVGIVESKFEKVRNSSTKQVTVPKAFCSANVSDIDYTTVSKSSCESGTHSIVEDETKTTNSIESRSRCSATKEDEIKTNLKVDTLTATRIRSFLGSTAAAAMKQRKSVSSKNVEGEKVDSCHGYVHQKSNRNKRTIGNSVAKMFSDVPQVSINTNETTSVSESNSRSVPELIKERTFLSPKLLHGTDSTDDNDSQDTVIGGVSLSPVRRFTPEPISLHELHNNVRIDDFDNLFIPSTQRKEITELCAPVVKIERVDTDIPIEATLCPESAIDSAIVSTSTGMPMEENVSKINSCDVNKVKQEATDVNTECNSTLPNNLNDTCVTQPGSIASPSLLPRTQREWTKGVSMLNASQSKSAIVDTLKELSTVLKYLTENSGKSKQDVAIVAEKMCRTLSSVPSNKLKVNSCSEVSSSVQDDMLTTQPAVKVKQEPLNDDEYLSALPQMPSISENAKISADNESVDSRIKKEFPDTTEMSPDMYHYIIKPSSEDDSPKTVDVHPSEQTVYNNVTAVQKSKINQIWNVSVYHDESDIEQMPHKHCSTFAEDQTWELPNLIDPSEEPDILPFETFGNGLDRSFEKRKEINMKHLTLNYPFECMKKEPYTGTSLLKPKTSSLTIKSGVLNKGLKFNSLRRKKQTRTLIVKQFPTIPPTVDKGTISECHAVTIKTEKATNQVNRPAAALSIKTVEVKHTNVYETVCQKLEQLKECHDDEKNNQPKSAHVRDQEPNNTKSGVTDPPNNDPDANPDNGSLSDDKISNEPICIVDNIRSDVENSHQTTLKVNEKCQHFRDGKMKKKTLDVIPFHTVIRLKRQQYLRYKRGESQKKFIDYRDVFAKLSGKNRRFMTKTVTNKSPEEKILKDKVKMEPQQSQEVELVKDNDHLGKKLNYFIPNFKNSAISKRGTALIEDKFRDHTEHVGSFTSNTTKKHFSPEKDLQIHSSETSMKDGSQRRSQSHKRESTETKDDCKSNSHRSRSRSSHRSQTSDQSRKRKSEHSPMILESKRKIPDKHYDYRHKDSRTSQLFGRTHTNTFRFAHHRPFYKSAQYFAKSSFSRSGTGYFSWRRKYQPNPIRRNIQEPVVVTGTGKVLPKSEYIEWTKFKQRETLRMQIESAIKEYRKTFEFTADDQKGDEKVASYLHLLTEKLDEIQNKRDKIGHTSSKSDQRHSKEKNERDLPENDPHMQHPERRAKYLIDKLERSKTFNSNSTQHQSSISRFSGSLASDSDTFSYKQRQHVGGIEAILKQHLEKHCEYITKQIKQEITEEIEELHSNKNVNVNEIFKHKTEKRQRDSEYKGQYYKIHQKDERNEFDRYGSSRSRESDETYCRYSSEKRNGKDGTSARGRRDIHVGTRPSGSQFYKDRYDRSTNYGLNHNYDNKKRDNSFPYKKETYNSRNAQNAGTPGAFNKYDFQQNYDRYEQKNQDRSKEFRPYKYKPWFQGKYDKSSWYHHKDTPCGSNSDRDYGSHFKKGGHIDDDDEFNAARYSKPVFRPFRGRGRGRGRGFFRGRSSYNKQYEPAKYSGKYSDTNYHKTKWNLSKESKSTSDSHLNSSSKDTINTEVVTGTDTDPDGPKPIPIVCSRRS